MAICCLRRGSGRVLAEVKDGMVEAVFHLDDCGVRKDRGLMCMPTVLALRSRGRLAK